MDYTDQCLNTIEARILLNVVEQEDDFIMEKIVNHIHANSIEYN